MPRGLRNTPSEKEWLLAQFKKWKVKENRAKELARRFPRLKYLVSLEASDFGRMFQKVRIAIAWRGIGRTDHERLDNLQTAYGPWVRSGRTDEFGGQSVFAYLTTLVSPDAAVRSILQQCNNVVALQNYFGETHKTCNHIVKETRDIE